MRTLVDRWLDWSVIGPIVAQYQALIDAEVAADTKKLYPYSAFISNVTQNYSSGFFSSIAGLQVFVDGRRNFLLGHPEVSLPAPTIELCVGAVAMLVTAEIQSLVANLQRYTAEAQRLEQRTMYDIEMLEQVGFCHGIAEILDTSPDALDVKAAGLNHFHWVLNVRNRDNGDQLYPELS